MLWHILGQCTMISNQRLYPYCILYIYIYILYIYIYRILLLNTSYITRHGPFRVCTPKRSTLRSFVLPKGFSPVQSALWLNLIASWHGTTQSITIPCTFLFSNDKSHHKRKKVDGSSTRDRLFLICLEGQQQ